MKVFNFLISSILWFWLFLIPSGIFGAIAYFRYYDNPNNIGVPLFLTIMGVLLGVFLAEYIRRKFGLTFFLVELMLRQILIS